MTTGLPDRKVLSDQAAAMRTEAQGQRKLLEDHLVQHRTELETEQGQVTRQIASTKNDIANVDLQRESQARMADDFGKMVDEEVTKADAYTKAGRLREAEEATEQADRYRSTQTVAATQRDALQSEVADLQVQLATQQRDLSDVGTRLADGNKAINVAEKQLDQLEDQARLLDQTAHKLTVAEAADNPVDQAQAELDAEKLYGQARAIQVDESAISGVTGRNLDEFDIPAPTQVSDATTTDDALGTDAMAATNTAATTDFVADDSMSADTTEADATGDASVDLTGDVTADLTMEPAADALASDSTVADPSALDTGVDAGLDLGAQSEDLAANEEPADLGEFA